MQTMEEKPKAQVNNNGSQCDEDRVIAWALEKLGITGGTIVDFGASDGIVNSNAIRLIEAGYEAILIESDKSLHRQCAERYRDNGNVRCVCEVVGFEPHDSLDSILDRIGFKGEIAFLSIDVDGNDSHCWRAIKRKASLVCVEFNPTIPTEIHFEQEAKLGVRDGSSLLALVRLGREKGYELIATTPWNAFFVPKESFPLFGIDDNSPHRLRMTNGYVTHVWCGMDGNFYVAGNARNPWTNESVFDGMRRVAEQHSPKE